MLASLSRRPLGLDFARRADASGAAPHVAQQLRTWLSAWADARDLDIQADGLVVRTTLDSRLQKAANAAVARQLAELQKLADARRKAAAPARNAKNAKGGRNAARKEAPEEPGPPLQAGFMAMDPRSGAIRAWVGSRDYAQEQFDHVSQARRQPGSTFKPFVYGAAFMQGISPDTTFIDQVVQYPQPNGQVWEPSDDSPPSGEPMTLRQGLALSKNTITAQLMQQVGPEAVARLARSAWACARASWRRCPRWRWARVR
jgi:penicillin-binding protein 1A